MALQRFSVNDWLNKNGYKSPSFDFTSTPNPYETAVKSSATKNKTLDLERFSVNDWLSENGYEAPTFDNYLKNSTEYRYLSDEAQTVVKEDEQTNGWLGAIVGSLGAGVANLLSSAASTIERAFVPNTFSAEEMNRFNNDIPVLGTTQEIEQQTIEAQAKRREIMQPGYTWADKNIKPIENAVREWADVENEGWLTKAVAGAAESTPALLASYAMPLLGSALMFNQSFANTLENDIIIANAKAKQGNTTPDYQNLMTKAVAAGAIEVATEKLFNLFAGMKGSYKAMSEGATGIVPRVVAVLKGFYNGFAKETAEDVTQATLKQFALHILKKSAEEGIEEIASTFLNGLVASATTDKDKPLFATKKYPDGIISWEEVRGSFVGGAIMGGVMSGASGMNQRSKTKKYLASIENTPIQQVTETQADGLNEAMMQDAQNPSFQQEIKANVVASTVQMQEAIRDNALRVEPIEYDTDVAPDATVVQPAITGEEPAINAKTETQTEPNTQTETFEDIINNRTETMSDVDRVQRWTKTEEAQKKFEHIKTEQDVVSEIAKLQDQLIDGKANEKTMLKVNLQLLALKDWATRIFGAETKGKRIRGIIDNLIPRLSYGKEYQSQLEIANLLNMDQVLYETMNMKAVEESAVFKMQDMEKSGSLDSFIREKLTTAGRGDTQLTPEDVYMISNRIKQLIDNVDDEQAMNTGAEFMDLLAREQTKMGQSTVIMRAVYATLWPHMAKSYMKQFRKATGTDAYNDNRINNVTKDGETAVKEAMTDAVKDVDKDIKEAKEKPEKTASEILAQRIKRTVERKQTHATTELMREVNELFKRYKQTLPKEKPAPNTVFDFLAEIAINRTQYREDVIKAIELLKKKYKYEEHPMLDEFYEQMSLTPDTVVSDATMYRAINKQMKDNDISLLELVKQVNLVEGSGEAFVDSLRSRMTLTDAEWAFLKDKLDDAFGRRMNQKTFELQEIYKRNASIIPAVKSAQEMTITALKDVTFYKAFDVDRVRDQWARRMNLPYINKEMQDDIYKTMRIIAKMQYEGTTDPDAVDREYRALTERLAKSIPTTKREKINALRRFGMLGNVRTHIKNGTTNIVTGRLYNLSDNVARQLNKTGLLNVDEQSRQSGESLYKAGTNKAIDDAVKEHSTQFRIQKMLAETDKYSVGSLMGVERQLFKSEWFDKLMKVPYKFQQGEVKLGGFENAMKWMTDNYMFEKHFRTQLANKLNALGYNEHMTLEQKQKTLDTAMRFARDVSIQRTFREVNALSRAVKALRNGNYLKQTINTLEKQAESETDPLKKFMLLKKAHDLKNVTEVVGIGVDFIVPFVVTPAALIKEGVKFSPIGIVTTGLRIANAKLRTGEFKGEYAAKLNSDLAQSLVGTSTMALMGLMLRAFGLLNLEPPEDEKGKDAWVQEGRGKYSLFLKGIGSFSIDWMQPLAGALIAGGATYDAAVGQSNLGDALVKLVTGNVDALLENSIITNITRQFGGYNKKASDYAWSVASGGIMQMLPSVLQQFNKVIDPYVRNAYSGEGLEIMANRALITLPAGSYAVSPKYDIWGKPIEQTQFKGVTGAAVRFVMNMVSPFTHTAAQTDSTTKEVLRVFESTKADPKLGSVALPTTVQDKFTMNGKTWELSAKQHEEYSQLAGQYQKEAVERVMAKSNYASTTDAVKAKAFKIAYEDAREKAKKEMIKRYPTPTYTDKS